MAKYYLITIGINRVGYYWIHAGIIKYNVFYISISPLYLLENEIQIFFMTHHYIYNYCINKTKSYGILAKGSHKQTPVTKVTMHEG